VTDPDTPRSGRKLVPLRRGIDDDDVELAVPRLEPLTTAQEAEAAELLAALLAAAGRRRATQAPLKEAA
jgi:hypothetical protein